MRPGSGLEILWKLEPASQRMKTMALDIEAALTTNAANARAGAAAAAAMPLAMAYSNVVPCVSIQLTLSQTDSTDSFSN